MNKVSNGRVLLFSMVSLTHARIMLKIRLALICLLLAGLLRAQDVPGYSPYLNVAYQGNFFVHPGISIGYDMPLRDLNITAERATSLMLQPQIGLFSFVDRNFGVLAGADLGIVRTSVKRKGASTFSFGLNYLGESEKKGFAVNLGSGDRSNVQREWRHHLLPTLNYEWSTKMGQRNRFFTKARWGFAIDPDLETEMYLLISLGIKLATKKS